MSEPGNTDGSPSGEPPPSERSSGGSLGLDDAWSQLSGTGKVVLVGSAVILLVAAAIGLSFGLSGGGDGEEGTAVISETAGSVVTLEVPPTTEVPSETETEFQTDELPTESTTSTFPDPEQEGVGGSSVPGDDSSTEVQVFTESDGAEIGTVSITEPSEVTWTSEGTTFVVIDEASGATLVDAVDAEGSLALEVGEYDLRVEADGDWTITVRAR
jgi:hypothetical protein